jgi:preprotein translocase subunit SecB
MEYHMTENTNISLPIIMRAQYIRDLSFENPNPLAAFAAEDEAQPNISVSIQAKAQNLGDRNFEVVLDINIEAKRKNETIFLVELAYGGIATVATEIPEEHVNPIIMIQVPHLMFPFARNIIADVTRDGGYPPLLLAPVDFAGLYEQQQQAPEANASVN